ncbi:MAG: adenylate/guanylate cyclase domain-containing protein [Desulfobacterales bacterium]|nr:MAG: adenylate/guanylate cyclase domain-containing protein [Desulfobacterales bacterium]
MRYKTILPPLLTAIFISCIVFAVVIGLRNLGKFESLELIAYDRFIRLKPKNSNVNPYLCIITITEDDIRQLNAWPISDEKLAEAIEILRQHKPRAIGVDIFRDVAVPPGKDLLDSILTGNQNIIGVMKFGTGGVPPPAALKNTDRFGFNDIIVDPGGTVRRGLIFLDDGKTSFFSFGLRLALYYLQNEGIFPQPDPLHPEYLKLGQTTIKPFEKNDGCYTRADSRGYQFLLDFQDNSSLFEIFSLSGLYAGDIASDKIKDKIVLIGVVAQSVKDIFYTPLSRGARPYQHVAGVVLHAHIISQLIRFGLGESRPIKSLSQFQEFWWIWLWSAIGAAIGLGIRSPWYFSAATLAVIFGLFLFAYFLLSNGMWIPVVSPASTFLFSSTLVTAYISNREKKQRTTLMNLFSKHVSHQIAETIWQQRDQFIDNGRPQSQELTVTVLFSDLKGFTSVAEEMDSRSLIEWLNTYMEAMVQVIIDYGGVVDDYAGDGIKANFGFPIPRQTEAEISQDAINAVSCTLAMEKEVMRLNNVWRKQHLPEVRIRVGIYTGSAVAGALGGAKRLKYTTVGDTVNIAARLESYNKDFAKERLCRTLISETTLRYLGDQFKVEKIGEEYLKGKKQKVSIYQVVGFTSNKN